MKGKEVQDEKSVTRFSPHGSYVTPRYLRVVTCHLLTAINHNHIQLLFMFTSNGAEDPSGLKQVHHHA